MTSAPVIHSLLQPSAPLPVVRLRRLTAAGGASVRVLLGSFAPAGSVFDTLAVALLARRRPADGWKSGQQVIIPSVADLGVSLALAAKREGLRAVVITPESISLERAELLRFYGAEVIAAPEGNSWSTLQAQATAVAAERSEAMLIAPGRAELAGLSQQALGQTLVEATRDAPVETLACGAGSGATFLGLRAALPEARLVLLTCQGPHPLQGWAGAQALDPELSSQADGTRGVSVDEAWDARRRLGREEGILVSLSSAANVAGALALAARAPPGTFVDTVAWSTGERDFSIEARAP